MISALHTGEDSREVALTAQSLGGSWLGIEHVCDFKYMLCNSYTMYLSCFGAFSFCFCRWNSGWIFWVPYLTCGNHIQRGNFYHQFVYMMFKRLEDPLESKLVVFHFSLDLYFNKNVNSERIFITVRESLFNLKFLFHPLPRRKWFWIPWPASYLMCRSSHILDCSGHSVNFLSSSKISLRHVIKGLG